MKYSKFCNEKKTFKESPLTIYITNCKRWWYFYVQVKRFQLNSWMTIFFFFFFFAFHLFARGHFGVLACEKSNIGRNNIKTKLTILQIFINSVLSFSIKSVCNSWQMFILYSIHCHVCNTLCTTLWPVLNFKIDLYVTSVILFNTTGANPFEE